MSDGESLRPRSCRPVNTTVELLSDDSDSGDAIPRTLAQHLADPAVLGSTPVEYEYEGAIECLHGSYTLSSGARVCHDIFGAATYIDRAFGGNALLFLDTPMADQPNPISITKGHIYPLSPLTETPAPPVAATPDPLPVAATPDSSPVAATPDPSLVAATQALPVGNLESVTCAGLAILAGLASDHRIADESGDQNPLKAGTAPEAVAAGPSSDPEPDPVSYTADPSLLVPEPLQLAVKVGSLVKVLVGFNQVVCGEVVRMIRDERLGPSGVRTGDLVATVYLDPPYSERTACVSVDPRHMQLDTRQLPLAVRVDTLELVAGLGKVLYNLYPLSRPLASRILNTFYSCI